jgi:predicted metalloprotease with PDZ domain
MLRDFSKHLERMAANTSIKKIDSHTWVTAGINRDIKITYSIYAFDTSVRTAYLDQNRAFFNGTSLCLQVLAHADQMCELELVKPHSNTRWQVETTLEALKVDRRGFGIYQADNYDALIDHPMAMGEFQTVQWQAHGVPHAMVIQGAINSVDKQQLAQDLKAICEAHITFFEPVSKRAPFEQYKFMVNAVGDGYGGLEHRDSTVLLCKRDDLPYPKQAITSHANYEDFLGLCSHEYFHSWMVKRVKPKAFQPYKLDRSNHTSLLWFFEGFTSYYDDLQLFRSGRITLSAYLKRLEKTWNTVLKSPGRHKQSVSDSSFDAWTKYYQMDENTPNAVVSYYAKGSLIALALDLLIREQTKHQQSLDDVMRHLWQMYQLTQEGMSEEDVDRAIEFILGPSFQKTWRQFRKDYIDGTKDLPLKELLSKANVTITEKKVLATEHVDTAKQLLGIRTSTVNGWVKLSHVLTGGLAQQAGLAAGDVLSSIDSERVTPGRVDQLLMNLVQKLTRKEQATIHAFRHETAFASTIDPEYLKNIPVAHQYLLAPTKD